MSLDDYLLDLVLVAVVVRQLRGRRVSVIGLLWPVPLVAWAGVRYLRGVSLAGHDGLLIAAGLAAGLVLGLSCAVLTRVARHPDGVVIAKASGAAALLWILGMGSRLAFGVYATHGGGHAIARFSAAHQITGGGTWTAALLLMALGEVLVRAATLGMKAHRLSGGKTEPGSDATARPRGPAAASVGSRGHPRWRERGLDLLVRRRRH